MSADKIDALLWSDNLYTLSDLSEKLKLNSCIVKSNEKICSELDYFEVLCFKHIYCVRAFKVSTPADRDLKDDTENNNAGNETLTSGDEVFIPLHYTGRGSIVPLYGESHVWKTVEELILTFPRYVLIEEDLKVCSDSKIIQLKAGCELELLRSTKDKSYQDKLICRYGAQTLQLNPSAIGRFRVRPDPNLYTVKDILQRLKLPQIIDFNEALQDMWEKEVNFFEGLAPDQNYTGKFLLTGLFKDKVAVAVSLGEDCRPKSQPFLIPLSSDLLQQLMFRFAFRGDFFQIDFKDKKRSLPRPKKRNKEQGKTPQKKEGKLKRGKSEAEENDFTDAGDEMMSGDEDILQGEQIPFELTYTQYRFPQTENKSPNQGDKLFKKVQSALKSVKGKFKKASSKDLATIRESVTQVKTPEPIRKASDKIYPILANLMNEEGSIYDFIESNTIGKKSGQRQSQFYFEIEPPKIASAPSEEHLSKTPVTENIYVNVDNIQAPVPNEELARETEILRKEPVTDKAKINPEMRPEVGGENGDDAVYAEVNGNEIEKTTSCSENLEKEEYMNYNQVATLQIRHRRESPSIEEVTTDWRWNGANSTLPKSADEKSDASTEEERSYAESNSSVNTDLEDYELEIRSVMPHKVLPVAAKRFSLSRAEPNAVECSSESGSEAGSDFNAAGSNNGATKEAAGLDDMSVMELCDVLEECKLDRISKLCQEHSLDGAFICSLPTDSLQEPPFSLSPLEVMKLSMMKKGWKPKIK